MSSVIMNIPRLRPSPKAKLLWAIEAAILWVVLLVGQGVWWYFDSSPSGLHIALLAASVVVAAAHIIGVPLWRYAVHRWEISETAVYTRTGWFSQESRIAPISRVQTVDTERGPIERLLGLATVTVTTASSAGAVRIEALDQAVADETVTRLTQIAALHTGDAT